MITVKVSNVVLPVTADGAAETASVERRCQSVDAAMDAYSRALSAFHGTGALVSIHGRGEHRSIGDYAVEV